MITRSAHPCRSGAIPSPRQSFRDGACSLALVCLLFSWVHGAEPPAQTRQLIDVLQSDAPLFEKARACQRLGETGSAEAVPALARLLVEPKLNAYARSGLEGIPGPEAAAALREAAQTLDGPLRIGVINSLGTLRDSASVELLARLAREPASGVVNEALLALGNIATPAAVNAVRESLASGPEQARADAAAACLLAADRLRAGGRAAEAAALYDLVRAPEMPLSIRIGATRGAILVRSPDRVPFLIEQMRSAEPAIRSAALLTVREIEDAELPAALHRELERAAPEAQVQILLAIADRHNTDSVPAVAARTSSPDSQTRKTALAVLGRLEAKAAPALLAALKPETPAEERTVAVASLKAIDGAQVDDLLQRSLAAMGDPTRQVDVIGLLESRGVRSASPELLKAAASSHENVRLAALSALKSLANERQLPELIQLVKSAPDGPTRDAAESALAGVCHRVGGPAAEPVLQELKAAASPAERNGWVRVLSRAGYGPALPAIEAAAADPDPQIAGNALAELAHWPDPAPMETLLKAVESSSHAASRQRALTSALDLASASVDNNQAPAATVVSWLRRVQPAATSAQDKTRVVGLLGRLKTAESFKVLQSYLEDTAVQAEAASALVQIAPALVRTEHAATAKAALDKAAAETSDAALRARAAQAARALSSP